MIVGIEWSDELERVEGMMAGLGGHVHVFFQSTDDNDIDDAIRERLRPIAPVGIYSFPAGHDYCEQVLGCCEAFGIQALITADRLLADTAHYTLGIPTLWVRP